LIVFDASTLISATLKADSVPERALLRAEEIDVLALSAAVDSEIAEVLARPKFTRAVSEARRRAFLTSLRAAAFWFEPTVRVRECRDAKDDKYLELALAAGAETIVSSDRDLLVLNPWRGVHVLSPAEYLAFSRAAPGGTRG
jgi:putative PIN family toxin of toxin-antitoxin system